MDFKTSWKALMAETLTGNVGGTWFVERTEALLPILRGMTAEQASKRAGEKVSSVAAHTLHTAYYMELAGNWFRTGEEEKSDWEKSWSVQTVDEDGWEQAVDRLEKAADALTAAVDSNEIADQDNLTYALANLSHAAFHLGSIRQLALLT